MRRTLASAEYSDTAGMRHAGAVSSVAAGPLRAANHNYMLGERLHRLDISDDGRWRSASVISDEKLVAFDPKTDVRRAIPVAPAAHITWAQRAAPASATSATGRNRRSGWCTPDKASVAGTLELPAGAGHRIGIVR